MKGFILLAVVLALVLAGCSTTTTNEVQDSTVVEQEDTELATEEETEVVEVIEEEIVEIDEEVAEDVIDITEEVEEEYTIDKFKGEYITEENIYVSIEEDKFVIGFYMSEGIIMEQPEYTFESSNILIVEGLALDGFDDTEYEDRYEIEWLDENTIVFNSTAMSYELERM